MPLQAGRLRHKVSLLKPTLAQNSLSGQDTITWVSQGRFWASVNPLTAKERFDGGTPIKDISHKVMLRYQSNVDTDWRVLIETENTTLSADINEAVTTVTIASGTAIGQTTDYYARIGEEIVKVTAGQGTTSLTVTRGQFGTTAASHTSGDPIFYLRMLEIDGIINYRERDESLELMCFETSNPF